MQDGRKDHQKPLKEKIQNEPNIESISKKHAAGIEDQCYKKQETDLETTNKDVPSFILDEHNSLNMTGPSSGLALKWESMKISFQGLKSSFGSKRFLPLHHIQEPKWDSPSESLDEIFQRLKQPTMDHGDYGDDEDVDLYDYGINIKMQPFRS